jgi:hypothetical protein
MTTVVPRPSSLIGKIKLVRIDQHSLFKFTDELQERMEELLERKKADLLTPEEVIELESIGELDRIFTHINALSLYDRLKIGIAHLEESLPVTADILDKSVADELREQIQGLDARLRAIELRSLTARRSPTQALPIEGKLSDDLTDTSDTVDESIQGVNRATLAPIFEEVDDESDTVADERGLSDQELGEVLGVSNLILRDYRVKGKKPLCAQYLNLRLICNILPPSKTSEISNGVKYFRANKIHMFPINTGNTRMSKEENVTLDKSLGITWKVAIGFSSS